MSQPPDPAATLSAFASENGFFLTLYKVAGAALRRTRDGFLARRLHTTGLRIGRSPRLAGLGHIHLGENFSAGDGLWLDAITSFAGQTYTPNLTIGPNCNVSDHVHIACTNTVVIGEGLLCGSRVVISDHAHGLYSGTTQSSPGERPVERTLSSDRSIVIGRNVWIGDGCAILPGADIGDGVVVGANSVVTGVIPPNTIVAGAPARPLRTWQPSISKWRPAPQPEKPSS